ADPLPEDPSATIETPQLVDHRTPDPLPGEALERHPAAVVEAIDGVDQPDDPGRHEVLASLHARGRYAHFGDQPRDVRAVALDELRPRVLVAEPGLRPPFGGFQAPPPSRTGELAGTSIGRIVAQPETGG